MYKKTRNPYEGISADVWDQGYCQALLDIFVFLFSVPVLRAKIEKKLRSLVEEA